MIKVDKSFGVILILRSKNKEDRLLILQQVHGHWSFPKGHGEKGESSKETAVRELEEETGIKIGNIKFAELPVIVDRYTFELRGKLYDKTVEYFIAYTDSDKVTIQESEIKDYKWVTFQEALDTFTFKETKGVLEIVKKYLKHDISK